MHSCIESSLHVHGVDFFLEIFFNGDFIGSSDGSSYKHAGFITSDQYGKLYISDENGVSSVHLLTTIAELYFIIT